MLEPIQFTQTCLKNGKFAKVHRTMTLEQKTLKISTISASEVPLQNITSGSRKLEAFLRKVDT